mmetsp:Transcript_15804/g.22951  ORF Transcript_15804/g.22951 Transcript_15804/m.22951 type:complete len:101 (+) Transcript_15804:1383-1685(+)
MVVQCNDKLTCGRHKHKSVRRNRYQGQKQKQKHRNEKEASHHITSHYIISQVDWHFIGVGVFCWCFLLVLVLLTIRANEYDHRREGDRPQKFGLYEDILL